MLYNVPNCNPSLSLVPEWFQLLGFNFTIYIFFCAFELYYELKTCVLLLECFDCNCKGTAKSKASFVYEVLIHIHPVCVLPCLLSFCFIPVSHLYFKLSATESAGFHFEYQRENGVIFLKRPKNLL